MEITLEELKKQAEKVYGDLKLGATEGESDFTKSNIWIGYKMCAEKNGILKKEIKDEI